ncbi:MAG: hypothetical protein K1X75_08445 [Leptospirales bacterium]|nr:hypothetical protein [Leptospirales bacterium]
MSFRHRALLLAAIVGQLACKQLHVDSQVLPRDASIADPQQGPVIQLQFTGQEGVRSDFAWSRTQYRVISSRMENVSGSLNALLAPALVEALRRQGLRSGASGTTVLRVHFQRWLLIWTPPREFIQTPAPLRRGIVEADLELRFSLNAFGEEGRCRWQRSAEAYDGEETFYMEQFAAEALRSCALQAARWTTQRLNREARP